MKFGKVQLRNPEQFERMDNVVRSTLHSFKVEDLNIYSMSNTVSYSFDENRIGVKAVGGTALEQAKSGRSTSKLVQRGSFLEILMGFPKDVRLITFAPLRWEEPLGRITDTVLGVVEITQDLSEDYKTIFHIQILVVITCTVLMGLLFVVLVFVVKRGEAIIERRAEERLRLKEQLSGAEFLKVMGVASLASLFALTQAVNSLEAAGTIRIGRHLLTAAGNQSAVTTTARLVLDGAGVPTPDLYGNPFFVDAEDFNYDRGLHQAISDVMPYLGGAYQGKGGRDRTDYHQTDTRVASDLSGPGKVRMST